MITLEVKRIPNSTESHIKRNLYNNYEILFVILSRLGTYSNKLIKYTNMLQVPKSGREN